MVCLTFVTTELSRPFDSGRVSSVVTRRALEPLIVHIHMHARNGERSMFPHGALCEAAKYLLLSFPIIYQYHNICHCQIRVAFKR